MRARLLTAGDLDASPKSGAKKSANDSAKSGGVLATAIENKIINADLFAALPLLPDEFADLIIIDPPYNLSKNFGGLKFNERSDAAYDEYLASWFPAVCKKLKANGSLYICGDWKCSSALQRAVQKELTVMNRITWQREKGEAVMQKRKVLAPYTQDGKPKDWERAAAGNFRLTHPSNFWDDISVPFWSMPENTDHPTQKPEKLCAKLILASCPKGGMVFDPFLGSGTTAVVAKKLGRSFCGIEINEEYCLWAQKRLERAESDASVQGYADGVFWERNTLAEQYKLGVSYEKDI